MSGRTITGIAGTQVPVHGCGDVRVVTIVNKVKRTCVLKEALYVPELGFNFVSIASVTDAGAKVIFAEEKVWLSKRERIVMTGRRIGKKLYHMDIEWKNNDQQVQAAVSEMQVKAGLSATKTPSLHIWHQRLAHQNVNTILKMSQGIVDGLKIENNHTTLHMPCNGCILGKMHRLPFPKGRNRAKEVGGLIHSDVCGPMQVSTPNSGRFFVLFKDDFSGWYVVHILKQKSEVPSLFINYVALLRKETGKEVKILRSDNGGEFCSTDFKNWLAKTGIRHETSSPHTPQQNGVSERANRTIMEAVRSQMHSKSIPLTLWGEMVVGTVYVLNRSLSSTSSVTPFETWYGRKPDVSHLRTLGSRAFAHIADQNRRKLDPKAEECILVGYSLESKAYRLWNPCTRKIVISRDVIVNESESNDEMTTGVTEQVLPDPFLHSTDVSSSESDPVVEIKSSEDQVVQQSTPETSWPMHATQPVTHPNRTQVAPKEVIPHIFNDTAQQDNFIQRRSTRIPVLTERYKDFMGLQCASGGEPNEPNSYQEAVTSEEANLWREAIREEYDSLVKNGTWNLTTLPIGRTAIKSRWVFKFKPAYDGVPERFKARLVAKGYTQKYGIDYHDTYAPVVKSSALRMILATVAALDLEMIQLDVKTAFLHGLLDEEIYMEQPEGFVDVGQENKVCRLVKSIYGLKQAPRTWNTRFNDFLLKFGLKQSSADPCVYFRRQKEEITIVAIFVDDGLACSSKTGEVNSILSYLSSAFEMRSLPANRFVGLEISRDRVHRQLWVTQSVFVNKLLNKCGMSECNPKSVPADPCTRLDSRAKSHTEEHSAMVQAAPYRETVGSLMYLMVMSRPDIAFAVNQVSKHCENPEPVHWNAVKRILAYLAGTTNFGLCFRKENEKLLVGYTDADYAGDVGTRRSTTGFVFLLHGGPVSWTSKQQSCTSLSTTESEYVAACETTKEAVWLARLVNEIEHKKSGAVPLWCDNQSAIRLVRNPEFHQRTKHIDVKYHFVRDQQANGEIDVRYVATQEQLADMFTKPLAAPRFKELREKIGVISSDCRV